ncbi:MAG TPA: hypothetical protein VFD70_05535 [Anaerolineae bacterium]|nr:hypothetical protein [Anaerolineae bacterium]
MSNIDPMLVEQATANPDGTFRVIVRVDGDMNERAEQLAAGGFEITRPLRLVHGFAATTKGANLANVINQDWVVSIEPDQPVHTMND